MIRDERGRCLASRAISRIDRSRSIEFVGNFTDPFAFASRAVDASARRGCSIRAREIDIDRGRSRPTPDGLFERRLASRRARRRACEFALTNSQALSFAAATAVVLSSTPAFATTSIELTDKRAENQNGLQLIYEVGIRPFMTRENDPESTRAPYPGKSKSSVILKEGGA